MDKSTVRNLFLQKRNIITDADLLDASAKIKDVCIKHILFHKSTIVHIFLPIQKKKEINTWLLIHYLWSKNIYTTTGTMLPNSLFMENTLFEKNTEIKINKWGIPEPTNGKIIPKRSCDIIFVPLLCFDKQGNRIGYGKGMYDRWLADIPSSTPKIGLSLFPPIEFAVDYHFQDVRIDFCITPEQIYNFDSNANPLIVL
ncbi:MAG: 5-formyltetrahydrofolate cyclo-ligase [Chitinophagaceae bacterium]|nr:5-formyltetrahydrofolate cyclo-ligase [Chitinophagaceae bacterium]